MNSILFPVVFPLFMAMVAVLLRSSLPAQRIISGLTCAILPIVTWHQLNAVYIGGVQALHVGKWPGPFGIVFVVDTMGALMIFFASLTLLCTFLFLCFGGATRECERSLIHPLLLLLAGSVNWAFSTGDLFNLFVSFEIMLIASYVLMIHGNGPGQLREGFKYVVLNMIGGMLFLATAGFAYGMFGTLNMAELSIRIRQFGYPPEAAILGVLFLLVFGMKAGMFPLLAWLPDTYPKTPPGIVAFFSGILTKVGIYALYRVFPLFFDEAIFTRWFQQPVLWIAALTMLIGVFAAYSQYTFRRILSFHIVSQIGYMIFGLAIYTPLAFAFGIFYVIHNMVVKSALLLVSDTVLLQEGSDDLKKVQGLIHHSPMLAAVFLVAAFSLAGIPPTSGFYGKFGFALEGIREGHGWVVAASIVTGLFTLASMVKIWRYGFWGEPQTEPRRGPVAKTNGLLFATGLLTASAIFLAAHSAHFLQVVTHAGEQLMDRGEYIQAVLGQQGLDTHLVLTASQEVAQLP